MGICVIGKGDILYWTGLDWNPKMCLCAAVCQCHQYIKILNVCVSMWVTEEGSSGSGPTVVTHDLRTYTLYCMCVMWTHSRSSNTVREQQLEWTQCKTNACQRHYCTRRLEHRSRGLCQTHTDVVNKVKPQKHTYVCSEERTVVSRAVLTWAEVRAPLTSAQWRDSGVRLVTLVNKGQSGLVDWTTALEYWNGLNCCNKTVFKKTWYVSAWLRISSNDVEAMVAL